MAASSSNSSLNLWTSLEDRLLVDPSPREVELVKSSSKPANPVPESDVVGIENVMDDDIPNPVLVSAPEAFGGIDSNPDPFSKVGS